MEHEQQHPTGPAFDTLKAAEALQQAGFTGVQARAVTQAIVEAQDNLASKADLRELRAEMKAEFKTLRAEMAELRADTKADIKALRAEIGGLRADVQALSKVVSTLEKVIFGVTVPMVGVIFVAVVSIAVDYFFLSR